MRMINPQRAGKKGGEQTKKRHPEQYKKMAKLSHKARKMRAHDNFF